MKSGKKSLPLGQAALQGPHINSDIDLILHAGASEHEQKTRTKSARKKPTKQLKPTKSSHFSLSPVMYNSGNSGSNHNVLNNSSNNQLPEVTQEADTESKVLLPNTKITPKKRVEQIAMTYSPANNKQQIDSYIKNWARWQHER